MTHRPPSARAPGPRFGAPAPADPLTAAAISLARRGGPPLRLRADCVPRTEGDPHPEPSAELRLWRRTGPRASGAVSVLRRGLGGPLRAAWLAAAPDEAAEILETDLPGPFRDPPKDPRRRLRQAIAGRRLVLALEETVGEAPFEWNASAYEAARAPTRTPRPLQPAGA